MKSVLHKADFCVVGGGLAGLCAAVSAARRGAKVVLVHDRPVLGGNASSEIRMWVCGAQGENNRETGIIEEIELENIMRNPYRNYSVWDAVLYGKAKFQKNLTLLLNCSCADLEMDSSRIARARAWQFTAETWHTVEAGLFADCSGDSVLAPLSGADFRIGREAFGEFGESIAPPCADAKTMGMSCLLQARETGGSKRFVPPAWAYVYPSDGDLPGRGHDVREWHTNFWWIEIGGEGDSVHGAEENRDELVRMAFGVWDHIKNRGDHGAENWQLEWAGFLPGKRESRRYVGDHVLTQNDVEAGGKFEDIAAYGGWPMDDHHPGGIRHPGAPTVFHPAPSPYGIPYRCLYSRNIENLLFAGRNISATHAAMSSARVMATCAVIGQAAGTAASIAAEKGLSPRGVYEKEISILQERLLEDDCFLPGIKRKISRLSSEAGLSASEGEPEPLRNGEDRPLNGHGNAWKAECGAWAEYRFERPRTVEGVRLVFDSGLNRKEKNMLSNYPLDLEEHRMPAWMVKKFRVEYEDENRTRRTAMQSDDNCLRLERFSIGKRALAVRFIPEETWGGAKARVFSFEVR